MTSLPPSLFSCDACARYFEHETDRRIFVTPAGAQVLTSRPPATPTAVTHASIKDGFAAANGQPAPNAASSRGRMEEKRINANFVKKDLEAEAATKIQAGFRGYKVRKQLKLKVSGVCSELAVPLKESLGCFL